MLVLSLSVVTLLRALGAIDLLTAVLRPLPELLHINPQLILPTLSKYLGGGTAMMGLMGESPRDGQLGSAELNRSIGFLLNPLDLPGLAILLSTGPRVAAVWKPAVLGALVGIALRTAAHALLGREPARAQAVVWNFCRNETRAAARSPPRIAGP